MSDNIWELRETLRKLDESKYLIGGQFDMVLELLNRIVHILDTCSREEINNQRQMYLFKKLNPEE